MEACLVAQHVGLVGVTREEGLRDVGALERAAGGDGVPQAGLLAAACHAVAGRGIRDRGGGPRVPAHAWSQAYVQTQPADCWP